MFIEEFEWNSAKDFSRRAKLPADPPHFVLFFGSRAALADGTAYHALQRQFPASHLIGCSTGGQFSRDFIEDDTVLGVAVRLEAAQCRIASSAVTGAEHSLGSGAEIGRALAGPDLRAILVLSDGLAINGSALVAGMSGEVGSDVVIFGGLAGDGAQFQETLVAANFPPCTGMIAAIGLYGDALEIGTGSAGGWDPFGPRRTITRSAGNVLFELDGEPALGMHERYLSPEEVRGLPGTALLFPLRIEDPANPGRDVMRTILAIDRDAGSLTFAGDMPQGWSAQLMRGTFDRLANGAAEAARQAEQASGPARGLTLLVSCIGRRLLMGQHAIDEVVAAADEISRQHAMVGFYSYGEISPNAASGFCQLHNQTMTVLSLNERVGSL